MPIWPMKIIAGLMQGEQTIDTYTVGTVQRCGYQTDLLDMFPHKDHQTHRMVEYSCLSGQSTIVSEGIKILSKL